MAKTLEALQRAEKEYQKNLLEPAKNDDLEKQIVLRARGQLTTGPALNQFEGITAKFLKNFSNNSTKTILFTGATAGSGSSTTAVKYATSLGGGNHLDILLIDVKMGSPNLHEVFNIENTFGGLSDLLTQKGDIDPLLKKVGSGNLYVLTYGQRHSGSESLFYTSRFNDFMEAVKDKFDYIIFDAPPVNRFAEAKALASKVDGVILVIESGKTRRQVAMRAKKNLEEAGGMLLGVILNKRKYYIPNWIYKRL